MARPRADSPPNRYTAAEMATAAGFSYRNFVLLQTEGLAPKPARRRVGAPAFDTTGLAQVALIGGLHSSGVELVVAARLAAALIGDFRRIYGRLPANLESLQRAISDAPIWNDGNELDDYLTIRHLRVHAPDKYQPGTALRGDLVVEIVDRRYIFTTLLDEFRIASPVGTGLLDAEPRFRVSFERGAKVRITSIEEEIPSGDFDSDPGAAATYKAIENEFLTARRNAIGLLRVNMSLAIRAGIDRLIDLRGQ